MNRMQMSADAIHSLLPSQDVYLGPARVLRVARKHILLSFPDQKAWAISALATYAPVAGDTVLVISQQDRWYVIGVLDGKGTTAINAPGNLELRAPHGEIRLVAGKSTKIKSDRVEIAAGHLEIAASTVSEKFESARRCVRGAFTIATGSLKAVATKTLCLKGKRLLQRADEEVNIDGPKIRLG